MLSEEEILFMIQEDEWMMDTLQTALQLKLEDWWVCAGFVRSKIWDVMHQYEKRTPLPDIDVIYFDQQHADEKKDRAFEAQLHTIKPNLPWSVKNQARMHTRNKTPPYKSSVDAMSKFPETATALGVTLSPEGNLILAAPHGINDAVTLQVKPTPYFQKDSERKEIYRNRVSNKDWKKVWPKISVYSI
ncbi:nucleotidyltransferase family protein [Alkalihalophilus marmarensis]|uniref:nucleotidyltransferase family protein n=1 Tax=Alkalihalophilus marmarensis TaxID=521377 RepID=UPI002E1B86D4|nr:nucleotidyltransferase family protein [Alkalihalophilus marmarensis]